MFLTNWLIIELLLFLNLVILVFPVDREKKKLWSLLFSSVLGGWLLFLLCGLSPPCVTPLLLNFFFLDLYSLQIFSFPILFSLEPLTLVFGFLTCFLTCICIIIVWKAPIFNLDVYLISLWLLQFSLFHAFTSINLLAFYVFFEVTLIPMFLIIVVWGARQRKIHAMYVFFFYTVVGSIFLLIAIMYLYLNTNTFLVLSLSTIALDDSVQSILWLLFFFGFAVKVPIVPFHTWLPEAHVEAPTPGSILLAGLLLKVGTFGMLRFMFPLLNSANLFFRPLVYVFGIFSIYHASLIAIRQVDLKKVIAYSSVAHMGFVILGLFSGSVYGLLGSVFIMFSHGIVASALFFLVGVIYDRYKTKNVLDYGSLISVMPVFTVLFFFFTLGNLSFPGTSNFIGELVVLFGVAETNYFTLLLATFSIVFTIVYSIWSFNRISFGVSSNLKIKGFADISSLEFQILILFCLFMLIFGLKPSILFFVLEPFILMLLN